MSGRGVECVDCQAAGPAPRPRPAPYPGPRCVTHHRQRRIARSAASHELAVMARYGLARGDYARLYAAQGGRCAAAGCRATGASRRLAVDHDHATGEVRGLLCSVHNKQLGQNRDSPEMFESLAAYLRDPPAREVLGGREELAA